MLEAGQPAAFLTPCSLSNFRLHTEESPMFPSPIRTSKSSSLRQIGARCLIAGGIALLAAADSFAEDPPRSLNVSLIPSPRDEPNDAWRQAGLAFLDFPLGIRARIDAAYSEHLYFSDLRALPYANEFGPGIRGDHTLESRIALSRPIARGIELEIAWESRNRLATSDPLGFGRQTIGARIRIAP